ncbi:AMP-binding protein [Amycolatopsis sp. H20-H5]|uniref:AMP-binding protein n=1 Tax=Amycolatopsis sp. H20-H5 TaxID=3046309 RepID=UPI002DB6C192|nr:AMP-binding protein [Amycolatopsis sp. H20-H5]MEC3975499.1 AMP-binding protein [Amycolatopsis sp. H20-H5]
MSDGARSQPDSSAVADLTTVLTYAELDARADAVAAALYARGVRLGDRVLLWAQKTVDLVAIMQGVLRIGAVYVPVGPSNPPHRVRRVIDDCRPVLVVADRDLATEVWVAGPAELCERRGDPSPPAVAVTPDGPVYILYTSGSTGVPKGVVLSDRNAMAFVEWATATVGVRGDDRLANHASFNFDLSVFDLYAAFRARASVHLIPETLAQVAPLLVEFVLEREITVWYSVPSVLMQMIESGGLLDRGPAGLRACVFAGEPFPLGAVQRLRAAWPSVAMFNWYGPTETNVCTSYEVTRSDLRRADPLPIGRACCGDTVALAGDDEIVVTGPTVMLGYWGREPHRGPYRTGDLGRFDATGNLHYSGRRDDLAKVRGHRVEPGEVEAALSLHDDVERVVVLVVGDGPDARLHAAVRPRGGSRPDLAGLRRHCAELLPRSMLIDAVHLVDQLPLNGNGKVDRRGLARDLLLASTTGGVG